MSEYDLPPISTLSAALGGDTHPSLHIAPELLDDPAHQSNNQDATQSGHQQDWTSGHAHGQWSDVAANTNNGNGLEQTDDSAQEPPRKKAKAPRRHNNGPMNHADFAIYLNEATNAEYEDPGRDYRAGAVFTYPASGANQACMRCHQIKRKCDNARPRCTTCSKSDMPCIFEMSPATAGFIANLKDQHFNTSTQLEVVQQRVNELESLLGTTSTSNPNDHHTSFGPNDTSSVFGNSISETDYTGFAQHLLGMDVEQETNFPAPAPETPLPPLTTAKQAVDAFFNGNLVHSMFLNKSEFMVDLADVWDPTMRAGVGKRHEFVVVMVTSVGAHICEAAGSIPTGTSEALRQRAMRLIPLAVAKQDLTSVQAYLAILSSVLLGLHPDLSATHILALATQTAVSLNLHRKPESTVPENIELRNRVWWTIYSHDRSLAAGLGRPLGVSDEDITADLPTPRQPSEDVKIGFLNLVIRQRKLLSKLHADRSLINGSNDASDVDSISSFEAEINEWRSSIPTNSNESKTAVHLLETQLLCLLYRPSKRYPALQADNSHRLRISTERSLSILSGAKLESSDTDRKATDLFSRIWRLQLCISHLFACAEEGRWNSEEVIQQVEMCRKLIESSGSQMQMKETKHLEHVFERLDGYFTRRYRLEPSSVLTEEETGPREILMSLDSPAGVGVEEEKEDRRVYDDDRLKNVLNGSHDDQGEVQWSQVF